MSTDALVGLLQFADGLFPAGGYAHSFGLETLVQDGHVSGPAELRAFLAVLLEAGAGPGDAVAVIAAHQAARARDQEAALRIDATLEAMKPAAELREASRQMGRQTLRVATALLPRGPAAALFAAVEAGHTPGHHAVAFGLVAEAVGVGPRDAAAAYLYSTAAVVVGAALRLLPLGQLEGQRVLFEARPRIARLAGEAAGKSLPDFWTFTPALDVAAMRHARLDARLFRS